MFGDEDLLPVWGQGTSLRKWSWFGDTGQIPAWGHTVDVGTRGRSLVSSSWGCGAARCVPRRGGIGTAGQQDGGGMGRRDSGTARQGDSATGGQRGSGGRAGAGRVPLPAVRLRRSSAASLPLMPSSSSEELDISAASESANRFICSSVFRRYRSMLARLGPTGLGTARPDPVRRDSAGPSTARLCSARRGSARLCRTQHGTARRGSAQRGRTQPSPAQPSSARHGPARSTAPRPGGEGGAARAVRSGGSGERGCPGEGGGGHR